MTDSLSDSLRRDLPLDEQILWTGASDMALFVHRRWVRARGMLLLLIVSFALVLSADIINTLAAILSVESFAPSTLSEVRVSAGTCGIGLAVALVARKKLPIPWSSLTVSLHWRPRRA